MAILAAAGSGQRLGIKKAKLWVTVAGTPLVKHTLERIEEVSQIDGILLMAPSSELEELKDSLKRWNFAKVKEVLPGGERRQDTVRIALEALPGDCETVVIHDAARPLASTGLFARVIEAANGSGAATAAVMPVDTIVRAAGGEKLTYLDRSELRCIQTPQAFKAQIIRQAHARAHQEGYSGTDDASLVAAMGLDVAIVEGEAGNFKVTWPEDVSRLEAVLKDGK